MTDPILELATITLAPGVTEQELVTAAAAFQRDFLDHQDGFIRRDMIRREDGRFVDVILWESRVQADAVFQRAMASPVAGQYFSLMQMDPETAETGVEHCPVLCSFTRKE
ncbi:hypothetical protein FHS89_000227 [Rubricella aquisinus]|uniref:ABM domain-containing protein n=1 Tax=Rubricella aquisinus TaxID=2028108 RepID=A0A840WGG6_9RHOB|nr:hypothetical protein [Rubricella aquisinus]MBB5514229.1 hypothetical protein [Rubricella aquisinus]